MHLSFGKDLEPKRRFRAFFSPPERCISEVKISQRASDGYRSNIDAAGSRTAATFDLRKCTINFIELSHDPIGPAHCFGARGILVARQNRRIHQAVGQSLVDQRRTAPRPWLGDQMSVA